MSKKEEKENIINIIKQLNTFIIGYIDDQEHNLVVDVEIHITGDQDNYNGMKYIPIDFFYIENGVKDQENYYNDHNLGAIIIKDDELFWTNDIEEAYYNDRLLGVIKLK